MFDWSEDKQSFEQQIELTRKEALEEWAEMWKPDEWDMAIDQGKQKKIRKNKLSNKRPRKSNPFQTVAEKKQKTKQSNLGVCEKKHKKEEQRHEQWIELVDRARKASFNKNLIWNGASGKRRRGGTWSGHDRITGFGATPKDDFFVA